MYSDEELMYVYSELERLAFGKGIVLDGSKYNGMLFGLPTNIPFVIRKLDDYKLESIEIYTDRTTMVMIVDQKNTHLRQLKCPLFLSFILLNSIDPG